MAKTPKAYRHYAKFAMLIRLKGHYTPAMFRTLRKLSTDFHELALDEVARGFEPIH